MLKSASRLSEIPFYIGFFLKKKETGTSVQVTFFEEYIDKNFAFLVLNKLAKFQYQAVFIFQVTFVKPWLLFTKIGRYLTHQERLIGKSLVIPFIILVA